MCELPRSDLDYRFSGATVLWHSQDSIRALAHEKAATFPRDTEWALHSRKAHRCIATRNCDFPQRLIARRPEGKKSPIRREHRAQGTREPRCASQWLAFTCREGTHIDLLVGDVRHLLPVLRERDELAAGVREVMTVLKGNLEPHHLACRGFG